MLLGKIAATAVESCVPSLSPPEPALVAVDDELTSSPPPPTAAFPPRPTPPPSRLSSPTRTRRRTSSRCSRRSTRSARRRAGSRGRRMRSERGSRRRGTLRDRRRRRAHSSGTRASQRELSGRCCSRARGARLQQVGRVDSAAAGTVSSFFCKHVLSQRCAELVQSFLAERTRGACYESCHSSNDARTPPALVRLAVSSPSPSPSPASSASSSLSLPSPPAPRPLVESWPNLRVPDAVSRSGRYGWTSVAPRGSARGARGRQPRLVCMPNDAKENREGETDLRRGRATSRARGRPGAAAR